MATHRSFGRLALALALLPTPAVVASAKPPRVGMEVLGQSADGRRAATCTLPAQDVPGRREFWIALRERAADSRPAGGAANGAIECGIGPYDDASRRSPSAAIPSLVTTGSVIAQDLPERVLHLEIALSSRRLTGLLPGGEPAYELSAEKRNLFLSDGGDDGFLLLVRGDARLGFEEVLVRWEALRPRPDAGPGYGEITLTSGLADGARLLVDGGAVSGPSADLSVRNVLVGEREIEVRAPGVAGRLRKTIRVVAGRRVLFDPNAPKAPTAEPSHGLVSLGKNPQGFEEHLRKADGAVVVKIPGGSFLMGNRNTERTPLEHRVELSTFLIDKTEVTWRQFKKFAAATGTPLPPHEPYWGILDDHPAAFVTWDEARAFCEWAGGRLPTEAEWERGSRGTDDRKFPWGNEEPDPTRAVFRRSWGFHSTDPVGSHPSGASPYGLLDMAGNQWEWCEDWYDGDYYAVSPARDPKGPLSGQARVVRGGSWDSRPDVLSCSCRGWGHRGYREGDFGFRCAMTAP